MNNNVYPVVGSNISQQLFYKDLQSVVPSDSVATAYQNLSSLNGINSMPQEADNMKPLMPAFLNQAHLSTYYQDNPWAILARSTQFGVAPLGGNINTNQSPGYKPGNVAQNIQWR